MSSAIYVDAAAQSALVRRMDSLANNIANINTAGFRADGVKFDSLLSTTAGANVAFPSASVDYISTRSGEVQKTGNPLDLAVRGDGWFSLMSPNGPVYTRDGRFQIAPTGELQSVNGYSLLDVSGAPIVIDPAAGAVAIAGDGSMSQNGRQIGAVGLFSIDANATLVRYDNSSVTSTSAANPVLDFARNGVMQGYIEQSNVNPMREITRLIEIQRAFENITNSMDLISTTQQDAIKTLGSPT